MQKRKLGKTNLEVSIIGFGTRWLQNLTLEESVKIVRRAVESGVNYFDTARFYGKHEEKLGIALQDSRHECVIAGKTYFRSTKESIQDFKKSLKALRTDHLDIVQIHGIDDLKTLNKAMSGGGTLETCKEARSKGLANYIGITSHRPNILMEAIKTGEFDTVMVPLNFVTRQAMEGLLPLAKDNNIGVAVMKPLSMKISNINTWGYPKSLSLLSAIPELESLFGAYLEIRVHNLLRFILAQDVSVVVPGFRTINEVEVAVKVGESFKKLSPKEMDSFKVNLGEEYCRDCGLCIPCPKKLNIPAILRFHDLSRIHSFREWAKELYNCLELKANECNSCNICESKCPYHIPISKVLQDISLQMR